MTVKELAVTLKDSVKDYPLSAQVVSITAIVPENEVLIKVRTEAGTTGWAGVEERILVLDPNAREDSRRGVGRRDDLPCLGCGEDNNAFTKICGNCVEAGWVWTDDKGVHYVGGEDAANG